MIELSDDIQALKPISPKKDWIKGPINKLFPFVLN